MDEHGIAWMIAGGTRTESPEDRRMRQHRIALAESGIPGPSRLAGLRGRIAALTALRPATSTAGGPSLTADCCA